MGRRPSIGMMVRGRHTAVVFAILLIAYAYVFPRWADWNQNSRFDLTRALVEHRTVAIDRYAANTGDYATVRGYIVSDKAPGLSFLAVPPYVLYRSVTHVPPLQHLLDRVAHRGAFAGTLNPEGSGLSADKADIALALTFVTFVCVAIPAALLGVMLFRLFRRFSPRDDVNATVAIVVMLATPFAAYGNAFYGHVPVAVLLFAAFALLLGAGDRLSPLRLVALGALFGSALVMEYPAALIVAALGIWTLAILWRSQTLRRIGWLALGSAPFLGLLALYDRAAYGTLLPTGYEHSTLWQDRHSEGFLSLTYPKPDAIWGITFGDFRGLFFLSPLLLLSIPGFIVWWRLRRDRAAWFVAFWSIVAFLLFDASSAMWWGGFAVGPRYLLPMLPFCCFPIGALIPVLIQRWRLAVGAAFLAGVSCVHVWMQLLAGQGYPPDTLRHPLFSYVWPRLADGDIARNAGMALGLHGIWSICPLGIAILALALWGGVRMSARGERVALSSTVEARYVRP